MPIANAEPIDAPLAGAHARPVDDALALSRYPGLASFRAELGETKLIGTPAPRGGARIVAKCEFENPSGSLKDRVAYSLLCQAVLDRRDDSRPPKILGYSDGNLAHAFGHLGRLTGIPIRFTLPDSIPPSLLRAITELGVRAELMDGRHGIAGIAERTIAMAAADPSWTMLDQNRDLANVAAHEFGTGREILAQLGNYRPTHLVASIGSGGTLAGIARALHSAYPAVKVLATMPAEMPYGTKLPPNTRPKFAGSGGLGNGLKHPFVECHVPDAAQIRVTVYEALAGMTRFEHLTGIRIGSSAAANWTASWWLADRLGPGALVVTVFPDTGPAEEWNAHTAWLGRVSWLGGAEGGMAAIARIAARAREDLSVIGTRDPSIRTTSEALLHPSLIALWGHRLAHPLHRRGHRILARLIATAARIGSGGIEIHPGAVLGRRLLIDHGAGAAVLDPVAIGPDSMIGARTPVLDDAPATTRLLAPRGRPRPQPGHPHLATPTGRRRRMTTTHTSLGLGHGTGLAIGPSNIALLAAATGSTAPSWRAHGTASATAGVVDWNGHVGGWR